MSPKNPFHLLLKRYRAGHRQFIKMHSRHSTSCQWFLSRFGGCRGAKNVLCLISTSMARVAFSIFWSFCNPAPVHPSALRIFLSLELWQQSQWYVKTWTLLLALIPPFIPYPISWKSLDPFGSFQKLLVTWGNPLGHPLRSSGSMWRWCWRMPSCRRMAGIHGCWVAVGHHVPQ